ncbi:MAG: DUF6268 family outer membrane beta-barrel protein [Bacteroidota bacterium]
MKKLVIIFLCVFCSQQTFGQLSDLARVEYTIIPRGNSNIELTRKRALFNYPIKLKNDAFLLLGVDYSSIDLAFEQDVPEFNQQEIEDFQLLDFNIGYTFKIDTDWRFGARIVPGFSSNLRARDLLLEDIVLSGDVVFIKDKKKSADVPKPYRLILGVSYSGNRGIRFPLPFISYYKKFHPKWSYNVGIPKSNLQYHWSQRFRLKLLAQLDGFNSNLQNRLEINNSTVAETIRQSLILGGLRFEYKFGEHLELYLNSTYIFNKVFELEDDNRDRVFELDNGNDYFFKGGLRFKI